MTLIKFSWYLIVYSYRENSNKRHQYERGRNRTHLEKRLERRPFLIFLVKFCSLKKKKNYIAG